MDPLTITLSALSIGKLCSIVASELKKFIDGSKLVGTAINALVQDVQSFGEILGLVRNTVDDPKVKASLASSGHIGAHWRHLQISLGDAEETFKALEATVISVNRTVGVLDSARKHIRLMGAMDKIGVYQQQVRSYKDTIQVSLQTTIL